MAEPVRLFSVALHIGLRLVTGAFLLMATIMSVGNVFEHRSDPRWLGLLLVPALFAWIFRGTIWSTRPLYLREGHVEIGQGPNPRRIPLGEIAGVDRPIWAYGDLALLPMELTLRAGDPVLFFPASGAIEALRNRIRS